jgi:CHAT domain-containing protein
MKRFLLLFTAALVAASVALAEPPDAKELVATAKEQYNARRYAESLATFEEARTLAESQGDAVQVAHANMGIAWIRLMRNDVDAAMALVEQARMTFEAAGDCENTARAVFQLASMHIGAGRVLIARELLEKALTLVESDKLRAEILQRLGSAEGTLGHHREAMEALREAIVFAERTNFRNVVAAAYHSMAVIHLNQGNLELAIFYEEKSLAIGRERKNAIVVSQSLNSLATIYDLKGESERAISLYREIMDVADGLKYTRGMVISRANIAGVYIHMRRFAEAEQMLATVFKLLETYEDATTRAIALRDRAMILDYCGEYEAALEDALAAAAHRDDEWRYQYESETLVGYLCRKLGRTDEARAALDRAIRIVETTRARSSGEETRFFDHRSDAYVEMAGLLADEGDVKGALAYAERYRSRVLIDLMRPMPGDRSQELSAEEAARERELLDRLSALQGDGARENEELSTARREYDAFQHDLADAHPRLRVERGTLEPVTIDEAVARLPNDAALVEYVVTENATYAFVISHGTIEVRAIPVTRDELTKESAAFRDLLAARRPDFRRLATSLHETLISPVADLLRKQRTWILIPDGPLWNLPFQALVGRDGKYVAEHAAIVYAPSMTAWVEMGRASAAERSGEKRRELLAFGNPTVPAASGTEHLRGKLAPLPEAETEVRSAARLYGAGSTVYFRDEATEERFKKEAGRYRILHLAGHGVLNDASPMHSYLILAAANRGTEDGYLEARELMQMNLGAELVVLSACETARGEYAAGEGIIGFSWALFAARCRTQVVSQWKVDSAATSVLMRKFHESVAPDRHRAASALQKSIKSMLQSKEYRHPFYWAGFVVLGDAL